MDDQDHPFWGKKGEVTPEEVVTKRCNMKVTLDNLKMIFSETIPLKHEKPKPKDPLDW